MSGCVDVKSIIDGLYATESGGECWVGVRELINVLGAGSLMN